MNEVSQHCRYAVLAIATGFLVAGCGQPPASTPSPVESLDLYAPGTAPVVAVYVKNGSSVEVRWESDVTTNGPLRLVYRDSATELEATIAASADGGSYAWSVPTSLETGTEYAVYAFSVDVAEDGNAEPAAVAVSAPFFALAADDTGTNGEGASSCSTNGDCDDGLYCSGVETCTNGVCVAGQPPCETGFLCNEETQQCINAICQVSDDCGSNGFCVDGMCVLTDSTTSDLQGYATFAESGAQVNFSQALAVGDTLNLKSPRPSSTNARALQAAYTDCTCAWRVEPPSIGSFDPSDACTTSFAIESAGVFLLFVDAACNGVSERYLQVASADGDAASDMCNSNGDCTDGLICTDGVCKEPPPPAPTIRVLDERTQAPYVVQFDLRLADAEGNVIPEGVSETNFRVLEDGVPIDLTETNLFVTPAANLPLRVMLVLDYTSSMAQSGAIDPMVQAARSFVTADHFTATHQIGVVEFHDRGAAGDGFTLAVPLTSASDDGKSAVASAIPEDGDVESGLSRVWDAVELAMNTLGSVEREPGEVQAVVFLTDGRDTTSEADADSIVSAATQDGAEISLYAIGFGSVSANEALLQKMADETGGAYFLADDVRKLQAVFENIALDLRGQWNLTYITPRNSGAAAVTIEFTWKEGTTTYETTVDANQLSGDIHTGIIDVQDALYNATTNTTAFGLVARYMPRNIDRFRFFIPKSGAKLTLQGAGGLTDPADGWTLTDLGDGTWQLFGFDALEYGAFGNIGVVTLPGNADQVEISHDDSVYDFLAQPKAIMFEGNDWAPPYSLVVTVEPEGAGTVNISPSKRGYASGETVRLQAIPIESTFVGWEGADIGTNAVTSVVMDADQEITAVFSTSSN